MVVLKHLRLQRFGKWGVGMGGWCHGTGPSLNHSGGDFQTHSVVAFPASLEAGRQQIAVGFVMPSRFHGATWGAAN